MKRTRTSKRSRCRHILKTLRQLLPTRSIFVRRGTGEMVWSLDSHWTSYFTERWTIGIGGPNWSKTRIQREGCIFIGVTEKDTVDAVIDAIINYGPEIMSL